jgi:hypothetical protein
MSTIISDVRGNCKLREKWMEPDVAIGGDTLLKSKSLIFKTRSEKIAQIHFLIIRCPAYAPPTFTDNVVLTYYCAVKTCGEWGYSSTHS